MTDIPIHKHDVYRDGKVHVMAEECSTCIFKPHDRPVDGKRVAGMVKDTMDEDGATIVCHKTIIDEVANAICRGWFDRLGNRDRILGLARAMDMIEYQEE